MQRSTKSTAIVGALALAGLVTALTATTSGQGPRVSGKKLPHEGLDGSHGAQTASSMRRAIIRR